MAKHSYGELQQMQSLSLESKIRMTQRRIRAWVDEYGEDGVYISFSGGKDSTVLMHIARQMYPNIKAVFVDTGLEYPEIRNFVKTFDNVDWLKPDKTFKQVIFECGYPFISKEVSNNVDGAKRYIEELDKRGYLRGSIDKQARFRMPITTEDYVELANTMNQDWGKVKGSPRRLAILLSMLAKNGKANIPSKTTENDRSAFSMEKYKFLLEFPWKMSDRCCSVMKKKPTHNYAKKQKRNAITAEMADESRLRKQKWMQHGCNGFDMKYPKSMPMAFWTEQDVLHYIKKYNVPIASIYGDIVYTDDDGMFYDEPIFIDSMVLTTTGCKRTGCMFCGYGCHLEDSPGRFELMKQTHPKQYDYIMRPIEEGGLNYKEVIDWLNEHGNLNIKY